MPKAEKTKAVRPAAKNVVKQTKLLTKVKAAKPATAHTQNAPEAAVNSQVEERNFIAEKIGKKQGKPRKAAPKKSVKQQTLPPIEERNFIVGIGASAGGLEALSDLIRELPDDLGLPYIVVQHLSPTHRSMMVPLLARETRMVVKDAEDGETPLPNVIYVTPTNWNIILKDGVIKLLVPGKTVLPKPSANTLFNSLAEEKGEDAIGVILSGTGSDGATGIAAIKAAGGFTFAQSPETAKYNGMPQAAISTGCVEWTLSCKAIAEEITAIARAHGLINRAAKQEENTPATMKGLMQMVYRHSKIDFSGYKEATLLRRVERRMVANRMNNLAAYVEFCHKNPDELNKLSKDIMISVTAFFRDRISFDGLRKLMKDIIAGKQPGDEIRIWVPGCATGEEAYSIGILLSDLLGSKINDYRIQIFATDIDTDAMAVGRRGMFNESSLTEVSVETVSRYFTKKTSGYEIARPIRDMVVFARQDLVLDPPFLRLDLISCRNLLIYFQPQLQSRVMSIFHFALRPSCYLFLGKSESIVSQEHLFAPVSKEARIFRRIPSKEQVIPIPAFSSQDPAKQPSTLFQRGAHKPESKLQKALTETYAPPSVLINKNQDIIEVHGDMQNYLHIPSGKLEVGLTQLLRREWRTEVQTLVHHAEQKNTVAVGRVRSNKKISEQNIQIEVHPVSSRDDQKLFMISFISLPSQSDAKHKQISDQPPRSSSELEDELLATREHLQTVIEELETSNEELQALNEETQAANEELQSSNEELEASNEELQSTNEELTTVNQELTVKGNELATLNNELENLQNSTGFSIVLLDKSLRVHRYNKEASNLFDFNVLSIGKEIDSIAPLFTEVLGTARLAMSDGMKRSQQLSFKGRHYDATCFPYTSQDHTVGGVIISLIDQTELIMAHKEIEAGRERVVAMMQNSPMNVSIKDPAGHYLFVNKAFEKSFGLKQQGIIGKTDTQIFPGHMSAPLEKLHFNVLHKKKLVETEECISLNGQPHWFSFACYPIFDDKGLVMAVCIQSTDITERLLANEKLLKLSRAVENSPASVVITDKDGTIEYVNRKFTEVTGYTAAEAIGKNPRILKSGVQTAEFYKGLWENILAGKTWQGEITNRKKSGDIYVESALISPIRSENGKITHFVAVKEDITQRKHTEQQLELAMLAADAANRAKSDFLANMSHEIRTPLNAILGLTNLCLQTELAQKQLDYLNKIHNSSKSLLNIIHDILEFSKIEAGKMDLEHIQFKLEDVLSNVASIISTKAEEKGLEFLFEMPAALPSFLIGDPMRLGQVLINLASNAVKFTENGEVVVRAEIEGETANSIRLRFSVSDTGIGMSEEQIGRLFHAFSQGDSTTTRKFGGTGLGLSISKQLVELMGGNIRVESSPGLGATFIFAALFGRVEERRAARKYSPDSSLRGMRVLAVDDNAVCRHILLNYLESFSFHVTVAQNGTEALRAIKQADLDNMPYRLVLLDSRMPKMSGIEAAQQIHEMEDLDNIPKILLFSSIGQSEALQHAEGKLVDGLLTKPFLRHELFGAIMEIFGKIANKERRGGVSPLFHPDMAEKIRGAYLLLVEDNEINQQVARELLERAGIAVAIAENGQEAIDSVFKEKFDGVLMDMQMPVMDGLTATREIRKNQEFSDLPIIAMTANVLASDRDRCLESGMNDYIAKPFEPNQLLLTLSKWIKPSKVTHSRTSHQTIVAQSPETLPELPGVNVDAGIRRMGGNVASYYSILEKFHKGQQNVITEIQTSLEINDWEKAQRLAHTLKGLLGTLGAEKLQGRAAELDTSIREKNSSRIESLLPAIDSELTQLFAAISSSLKLWAASNKMENKVYNSSGAAHTDDLLGLIRLVKQQLKEFNSDAERTVAVIRQIVCSDAAMLKAIDSIAHHVSGYDYERGLAELNAYLKGNGYTI